MLDCLPSNEVQVKGCFWCGLQTRVLFCWSSPDLNPKQPDLSNALQTSILNTHLIFISGFNSSSGGCSKSLGPIIPNCRRRVSWKLVLSCEQKHQFVATVVVCTSKNGRHSRAAIKQAEKADNRDFRQVRSGMQSVWASPQQGARAVRRCGTGLVELDKRVTKAAKHVVLLVQQLALGVTAKWSFSVNLPG